MNHIWMVVLVSLLVGCGTSGREVSQQEFGAAWPFTVVRGHVDCVQGSAAIFKAGGTSYQLNGFATSRGYTRIDPIWRDNPNNPGTKVPITPILSIAMERCR
jgi:hypothetical protein